MAKTNYPKMNFQSPAARLISGDHINKRTTDLDGRPIPPDDQDYQFGIAIRKDNPDFGNFWNQVYAYAAGFYGTNPDVKARMDRGFISSKQGGFSWKIKDGDAPNSKGQQTPNAAGCWIVYLSTSFPVTASNNLNVAIDPSTIKRGYYVDIAGSIAVNGEQGDRAGIFVNPNIIRLLGYGEEIHGGLTPEQAFGSRPLPALPQGASATPLATPFPQAALPGPGQPQQPPYGQPMQQPYGAPPNNQPPVQPGYAPPAGYPSTAPGQPYPMTAAGPTPGQPAGYPPSNAMPYGAPPAVYPSNPGPLPAPQYGQPQPGFPAGPGGTPQPGGFVPPAGQPQGFAPGVMPAATMPPNSYPIDPRTGQPIQPQPQFLQPGYPPR